jgi:hypothetical protein
MKKATTQSSNNQRRSSVQKNKKDEIQNSKREASEAKSPKISEYRRLLFSPKFKRNVDNTNNSFQKYEIKNVAGMSSAKLYEIESTFKRKGLENYLILFRIHIFDIKTSINVIGDDHTGKVSFNVRGELNDDKFVKSLEEVNSNLQKEYKLRANPVQTQNSLRT